jgi:outer membrane protein assembly factor BamD
MRCRGLAVSVLLALLFALPACSNKKIQNPIANVDSKQPDKVLFDRAMQAMKHNQFDVARMSLQTLINTYPDSEFVARAKLGIADSWYAEGGTTGLAQARSEYEDFKTFFPNMPEAAEAQMKIADIEYQQMEKPDRDYTHAKRAEEEYRNMILQYPDSKLVPQAKEKLREVQEVLAQSEFDVGRFYYLRPSYMAAIARLKSLADTYPLFSGADEALFLLADSYQRQAEAIHNAKMGGSPARVEALKATAIKDFEDRAAQTYARIITRYPVSNRAGDARRRLAAMKRPIPKPTRAAIAQNRAEQRSRGSLGFWGRSMDNFHHRPDVSYAARIGEPPLTDPKPTSAPQLARETDDLVMGRRAAAGSAPGLALETTGKGTPPPNQPPPRSDAAPSGANDPNAIPELRPLASNAGSATGESQDQANAGPLPAPAQVNEAAQTDGQPQASATPAASAAADGASAQSDDQGQSTSKKKKKKGLSKLNPF